MTLIAQLTTVHTRNDIRIRIKQCAALARSGGLPVTLYVQDGKGDEIDTQSGVRIADTGPKTGNRAARMTIGSWRMWRAVRRSRPAIVHFHDPELMPTALALRIGGARVIYDVHEDLPRQIMGKYYLAGSVKKPMALLMEIVEQAFVRCMDAVVPATPAIAERFPARKTVVVQNFPLLDELVFPEAVPHHARPPHFAYVGGITVERGALEMAAAIEQVTCEDARLVLAGAFSPQALASKFRSRNATNRVHYRGWVGRGRVAALLGSARAGLVLFHPLPNHCNAQPNKMFEYMAAGLPVIASDFPLWRKFVDDEQCGLLVDPTKPGAIAEAMQWILDHPSEAAAMGQRGRNAVERRYNWERESEKLISLYQRLTKGRR